MGRFDALLEIEDHNTPPQPVSPPTSKNKPQTTPDIQPRRTKFSTRLQTHLSSSTSPTPDPIEKPEKYTTHLEPSLVKRLKLYATENDKKDYQVIREALLLYFEKIRETD